jgi:hypothetical protein
MTNELSIVERLHTEADLCRNETADDVATLLDEAADEIERLEKLCKHIACDPDGTMNSSPEPGPSLPNIPDCVEDAPRD